VTGLGPWDPLPLSEVARLLPPSTAEAPWWIAGGYAIELFVGSRVRDHDDIDVLVLRRDQCLVHAALPGWNTQVADPPGQLRPWPVGETLPDHVHDIWCRETPAGPWRLQFMLDESDQTDWHSRRDRRISRPIRDIGRISPDGLPYLVPEIQLFYKAMSTDQPDHDETDFAAALPLLDSTQRRWLDHALQLTLPDHPWRAALCA
jgi:hypothetical protein